jgi:hypothetical protein
VRMAVRWTRAYKLLDEVKSPEERLDPNDLQRNVVVLTADYIPEFSRARDVGDNLALQLTEKTLPWLSQKALTIQVCERAHAPVVFCPCLPPLLPLAQLTVGQVNLVALPP